MRSHNPGQQKKKKTTKKRKADNNAANDEEVHHPKAAPSILAKKKKRRVTTTAKQAARNDAKDEKAISKASVTFGDEQHRQGTEEPMAKKKKRPRKNATPSLASATPAPKYRKETNDKSYVTPTPSKFEFVPPESIASGGVVDIPSRRLPFPESLHAMISYGTESVPGVLCWDEAGDSFTVKEKVSTVAFLL